MPLLSIIVPVYNEVNTIRQILEKINAIDIDKEMVVVDDGSSDGTDKVLHDIRFNNLKVIHHTSNRGKGVAFLTGLGQAAGEFVIVQDADLEYDPKEYFNLMKPLLENKADIALGVRFGKGSSGPMLYSLGNKFLTGLLNFMFASRLNDYATCYKMARRDLFLNLGLKAKSFEIEVEIVCNALKKKMRIIEVPVSYHPRSYREGKKIRWADGLWAIYHMFKYRFT